jgi:hypothetical protein
MQPKKFYLLGEDPSSGVYIEVDSSLSLTELRNQVADKYGIVEPSGKSTALLRVDTSFKSLGRELTFM